MTFPTGITRLFCMLFLMISPIFACYGGELRIISLVPETTEFLSTLGFGSSLVGISDSCVVPPETALIPRVGGMELNLEKIAGLKPTLIVDLNGSHKRYELFFSQLALKYLNIEISRLEGIPSAAVRLSQELGSPAKGDSFCEAWNRELSHFSSFTAQAKPRVYIETWDTPLQSATRESFIGQLVQLAGGENIVFNPSTAFPVVTDEEIIRENPEVILLAYPIDDTSKVETRSGWGDIDAVRKKRIFKIDDERLLRPGPMALKNIKHLSSLISRK